MTMNIFYMRCFLIDCPQSLTLEKRCRDHCVILQPTLIHFIRRLRIPPLVCLAPSRSTTTFTVETDSILNQRVVAFMGVGH